ALPPPPAPAYRGPGVGNNTPVVVPPKAKPVANNTSTIVTPPRNATLPPKTNATVPPKQNASTSAGNASNASAPGAPGQNASNNTTASPPPPSLVCGGSTSSDALDCISQAAIVQKNVVFCTQLVVQDARYQCLTRWCYSAARDYKQCDKLANNDDRLGCLNKCNPNFNT
ncbi:MAG: hypothetical protein M1530_03705, partial [Candidatus Marsarchaeota archaeon]|nr:hypothetical protein [Candidatus Marsarchaeota archaeon]